MLTLAQETKPKRRGTHPTPADIGKLTDKDWKGGQLHVEFQFGVHVIQNLMQWLQIRV